MYKWKCNINISTSILNDQNKWWKVCFVFADSLADGWQWTGLAFTLAVKGCGLCYREKPVKKTRAHSKVFTASFHWQTTSLTLHSNVLWLALQLKWIFTPTAVCIWGTLCFPLWFKCVIPAKTSAFQRRCSLKLWQMAGNWSVNVKTGFHVDLALPVSVCCQEELNRLDFTCETMSHLWLFMNLRSCVWTEKMWHQQCWFAWHKQNRRYFKNQWCLNYTKW